MSKPVGRTWRPPLPSPRPAEGPDSAEAARRVARVGRAAIPPASVLPKAQHRRSLPRCRCGDLTSGHLRGIGPRTRNLDPDPRRRSNRGSGAQNRPACAAILATRRLRPVPSQRFLALWSQAHTPSCSRQVTSTSIRMVKPGAASALRGHAPLRTDTLPLARTIPDRRIFTVVCGWLLVIALSADWPVLGRAASRASRQASGGSRSWPPRSDPTGWLPRRHRG
jgi:hypothetical protein